MEQEEWTQSITRFQARCLGYLTRKDLGSVQAEFEDVVRELEGSLENLTWRGQFIPKPHFTDRVSGLFRYHRPKIQTQDQSEAPEKLKKKSPSNSEILEAERDEEPSSQQQQDCRQISTPPEGDREETVRERESETAADFRRVALETNSLLQKDHQASSLLKDVAHTPEALRQHRRKLAMELLWIQQAIASRKKYLTLKQKMEVA
ncbi:IQ domain-containing protein C [Astyanax mexicanus]|uniref:IQ domain-containing protein C n=1 Tax=Astyanax mexicanus TaxID=7994 RepID=UPI0020CACB40|nr:IQ domain-containing protein C [Astyanax mexicanus]